MNRDQLFNLEKSDNSVQGTVWLRTMVREYQAIYDQRIEARR